MSDIGIVERLHNAYAYDSRPVFKLAAARIERLEAALREAATSLDQAANELCDCRKAGTKRVCRGAHYEQAAKDARAALEEKNGK